MRVDVKLVGTEDIRRKLLAMPLALRRETLVPVMERRLEPMADEMRVLAPERSGELAGSVTVSTELSPHQGAVEQPIAPIEVFVGPGPLPQAVQEEFGNFHQPAHPFIRPAYDTHVDEALTGIGEDGIDAILQVARKG